MLIYPGSTRWLQLPFFAAVIGLTVATQALSVAGTLPNEAYVWQRAWGEPLRDALRQHGSVFTNIVALRAEVAWKAKLPHVVHVPVDYRLLATTCTSAGLALRMGTYPGPFSTQDAAAQILIDLARSIVTEAKTNGLKVRELQLDFDCAESKLEGYRVWVQAIRSSISPVPLTITVLPSWLDQRTFAGLVSETAGYILQVHSLERPKNSGSPASLCDPSLARKSVQRAATFHKPFRVALPTYGYYLAFHTNGQLLALSAEGPLPSWPQGTLVRELRSDPVAIGSLVRSWAATPPPFMQGIIWYRLPVEGDILNWRWPTLSAIIGLRSPHESMRAESRRVEPGLVEISLVNDGELDISSRLAVEVRWSREDGARLLAADGLRGFEVAEQSASALRLKCNLFRLPAGEKHVAGWLRFNKDREVQVEFKKF